MTIDRNFKFEVGKYYVSTLLWHFATPKKCLTVREAIYGGFVKCQYATFAGVYNEYIANPVQFREATEEEIQKMQAEERINCRRTEKYKAMPLIIDEKVMQDFKNFVELSKN